MMFTMKSPKSEITTRKNKKSDKKKDNCKGKDNDQCRGSFKKNGKV